MKPTTPDRYSRWFATPISGVSDQSILPGWAIVLVVLSAVALAVVIVGRLVGTAAALAVGGAWIAIGLLLIRSWLIAISRVHRYLLGRQDLDDVLRASLLLIAGLALVVAVVAAFAFVAVGSTVLARIWRDLT